MELPSTRISSVNIDQQQQKRTSLVESNSNQQESMNDDCLQKRQQWETEQSSTSLSIISLPPKPLLSRSTIKDFNLKQSGSGHCNKAMNARRIREQERDKLVRFVFAGQVLLVIIVALVWLTFMMSGSPKTSVAKITNTPNPRGLSTPPT